MVLFACLDLVKRNVSYIGCILSILVFYVRISVLYNDISYLLSDATSSQIIYLCTTQYFSSNLNYLIFDGCIFSTLYLLFNLIRYIFFGKLSADELSSMNDMLASTTLFRLIFMFYIFYYYNDLDVFEFAFWSIITELTLCFKAITYLVILRCKLVPQSFEFDQALPINILIKYTFIICSISIILSVFIIYYIFHFFYIHTGIIPILCLLFDTIIVGFDNIHSAALICVHFNRKNTDIYVYYTDLLCNVCNEILKLFYYIIVVYVIGISFSLIGIYVIMKARTSWMNIRNNIKAYRSYQQMHQQINHQYPDATKQELHNDKDTNNKYELCGICREQMEDAKKLPCSHKFHLRCLMGWMRYKHNCPICRRSLTDQQPNANANANGNQQAAPNNNNNNNNNNNQQRNNDLPWWLRLFSNFVQIHNIDIIDARNLNRNNQNGNNIQPLLRRRRRVNLANHIPPNNVSTEQQITTISEILGGRVADDQIRTRLLRTHSMERTIEYFLTQQR